MAGLGKFLLTILALVVTSGAAASECRECELEARLAEVKSRLASCEEALKEEKASGGGAGKDSYWNQGRKEDTMTGSNSTPLLDLDQLN